jgi:hypothetical protein
MSALSAAELAAIEERAKCMKGYQIATDVPRLIAYSRLQAAEIDRLIAAIRERDVELARLRDAIEEHRESVVGFMGPLDIDSMPDGARWVVRTLSGKSKALWSALDAGAKEGA